MSEEERRKALQRETLNILELIETTSDLLELVEPCLKDPQRDYCVTHHQRNCRSDELVRRLRELLEELEQ